MCVCVFLCILWFVFVRAFIGLLEKAVGFYTTGIVFETASNYSYNSPTVVVKK